MLTRREFIKALMTMAAGMSIPAFCSELLAEAAGKQGRKPVVIYLEANTCAGDIMSLLNAKDPSLDRFIQETIDLQYQTTLMAAEGSQAVQYMYKSAEENWGEYVLIVEGAVSTRENGKYGIIGELADGPLTGLQAVRDLAQGAKYIVPFGVCACYGGQYATPPNPCGAKGVSEVIGSKDRKKVVNVSACPGHPEWLVGTLTHLFVYGMPDLDPHRRPKVFNGRTVHDLCPRRSFFEKGIFASKPGERGCLYKIGCKGPVAGCDVPLRHWNTFYHWQWVIGCNVPCIGCTEPGYPTKMMPFYRHLPDIRVFGSYTASTAVAKAVGAGTGLAIAGHLGASLLSGRVRENYRKLKEPLPPLPPEPTPSADFTGKQGPLQYEFGDYLGEPDLPSGIDRVPSGPKHPKPLFGKKLIQKEGPDTKASLLARQISKKWKD
ncbi:MAG: hydrogenase small subunit [Firmicutes bacterium]|nr:hydrogenase small subunit [Bacillota bacterium]